MINLRNGLLKKFWFVQKNKHAKRHEDFSHLKTKNRWLNFLIDFSRSNYTDQWVRGRHQESCHLETEKGVKSIKR